jgi:hypothetical protein
VSRCSICGSRCVPCVDNLGQSYMGCPVCIVADPKTTAGDCDNCGHPLLEHSAVKRICLHDCPCGGQETP